MGRWGIIVSTLLLAAGVGCRDDVQGRLDDLKKDPPGHSGAGGAAGGCEPGTVGSGGGGSGVPGNSCASLSLSSTFESAPAADGQLYKRCETIGLDNDWHVTLSADGRHLAARTSSGTLRLIDTHNWREIAQMASPLGRMDAAEFSADGRSLVTLSAEMGGVTLWRTANGGLINGLAGPPAAMIGRFADDLAFSADAGRLATSLETVMNLTTGASTFWANGSTTTFSLIVNPESTLTGAQNIGQTFQDILFLPDDQRLYVKRVYQTGNSNPQLNVSLLDPSTGGSTVLTDFFDNLSSAAISKDGRFIAIGNASGFPPFGLTIYRTDTGQAVVNNPTVILPGASVSVLGFSNDGTLVALHDDDSFAVRVLDAADLHEVRAFLAPGSETILGISPFDDLVSSDETQTVWRNIVNGESRRVAPYRLTEVTWSADGQFGAGTNGGADALFHFWREPDGTEHCAPPPRLGSTPPLASFGGTSSADGSVVTAVEFVIHTHAADWNQLHVRDASGTELRQFRPGNTGVAVSADGSRLYTNEGTAVAVWCR